MSPKEDGQEVELKRDGGPLGLLLERMIMVTTQICGAYPVTGCINFVCKCVRKTAKKRLLASC
jgi:hypothetical protein